MAGIVAYGVYVPYWRLSHAAIANALEAPPSPGFRSVASFDEDTTTMAVAAASAALNSAPSQTPLESLVLATTEPVYLDKTNASAVHAALSLDESVLAWDAAGSVRSASATMRMASQLPASTLLVHSDTRNGLPGGVDERSGGDAAAALLFGRQDVIAEVVATACITEEFVDRYRAPGHQASVTWEERFGEGRYLALGRRAFTAAIKHAGITADRVDYLIVSGLHHRANRAVVSHLGVSINEGAAHVTSSIGNTGLAQAGVLLADVLDRAAPGQHIVSLTLADGADAIVLRTTEALLDRRPKIPVAAQIDICREISYTRFLTWRGTLRREPPRRPEPARHSAPAAYRHAAWKFALEGSECRACGARQLPPQRVCVRCRAHDKMLPLRFADRQGRIATLTVDRLAFSLNPPVVDAVIDFDGGGRFQCELTDVDPTSVNIGDRVRMTFRRISTGGGLHNYFWKARPTATEEVI